MPIRKQSSILPANILYHESITKVLSQQPGDTILPGLFVGSFSVESGPYSS